MEDMKVHRWNQDRAPDEGMLRQLFAREGLQSYRWSNGPGDHYAAHQHSYFKVIYVVQGTITFGLPELGEEVLLGAGDRLDLPANMMHQAVVGPEGVVCLEAHRRE